MEEQEEILNAEEFLEKLQQIKAKFNDMEEEFKDFLK